MPDAARMRRTSEEKRMHTTDRAVSEDTGKHLLDDFTAPKTAHMSMPKWIWNTDLGNINAASIREQLRQFKEHDGYGGVMIVLWGHKGYLSEKFYSLYGQALDIAAEVGIKIILWDENGFPTGFAGGVFEKRYPDFTARRLEMKEIKAAGPCKLERKVPPGALMGVVAMNEQTGERLDLTDRAAGGVLRCGLPAGKWSVMFFTAVKEGRFKMFGGSYRFIDYLNSEAVDRFIHLTHQEYYNRFPAHFGTTIRHAFYDEPSFWRLQGRIWTEGFNRKFEEKHGYSPVTLYPALWRDIGEDTQAARNALLGFRAELYATAFVKNLADWCVKHNISLTGHMDQEEIANPVPLTGDLMKVFEHQHMPGVDEIFKYGRGSRGYKVVSSAACNYDKPAVMCESYGAMGEDMPVDVLYREAMDQYAKGVSFMVPHGTWYDNVNDVIFPPELSYRSKKFGPELPAFNAYIARLSAVLQGGRHVSDIAVLYPIAALQAGNVFGQGDAYLGGAIAGEINYMDVGELLSLTVRRDFTYLHPEVLDGRCEVRDAELCLNNNVNREHYKVLVLTGSGVIHWSNARKILQFYNNGGKVLSVGQIPHKSAEFGHDGDVAAAMKALFGLKVPVAGDGEGFRHVHENGRGGLAIHIPAADAAALRAALDEALDVPDVLVEGVDAPGGNFSYIHKVKDGRHIYFFGNSGDGAVHTTVSLRGRLAPEFWDPHTCERKAAGYEHAKVDGADVTRVKLELPAVRSVFVVASEA